MWSQFFLEHIHFALNVLTALVFFAVAWLYFDAWTVKKTMREILRVSGFLLLSISFLVHGLFVESQAIGATVISTDIQSWLFAITRLPGYLLLIGSLLIDPINPVPLTQGINQKPKKKQLASIGLLPPAQALFTIGAAPLLALVGGLLYLYRATAGLERHLFGVAMSILILAFTEILNVRSVFTNTVDIGLYELLRPYGPIWMIEHVLQLISMLILGKWVFGYLLKRFETQLFILFTTTIVIIFLFTSISLTSLLLGQSIESTKTQLTTDAAMFRIVLNSQQEDLLSFAKLVAESPETISLLSTNKRRELAASTQVQLKSKQLTGLIILNDKGTVIANGVDIERFGESSDDHPLFTESMKGQGKTAIRVVDTGLLPTLSIEAASPITQNGTIIGVVLAQNSIDTAVLDGVKKQTGLDVSLYAGTTLSATTLLSPDGVNRPLGILEQNKNVITSVLTNNESFTGSVSLLNRPYIASYSPLSNVSQESIGMVMVGKPASEVLSAARRSIEATFLLTTLLLVLSVIPSYIVSQYLVKQIH